MKPHHDFQAERMVANHCQELMTRTAPRVDVGEAAQALIDRTCVDLAERLRAFLIGPRPVVTSAEVQQKNATAVLQSIGKKASNYSTPISGEGSILVSLSLGEASRLTDRLFGGDGASLDAEPDKLPMSGILVLERLVSVLAQSLAKSADLPEPSPDTSHDTDAARIAPFDRGERCLVWEMSIAQGDLGPWSLTLAIAETAIAPLLDRKPEALASAVQTAIFDEIPLPVSAVLAQMKLPLDRLASLQPGDTLPMAPSRSVPLVIAGTRIAEGRVGTFDDRVALQLTHIHSGSTLS